MDAVIQWKLRKINYGLDKNDKNWCILADRGFVDDALHYPNLNEHITPQFMTGRKQFEVHEISADRAPLHLWSRVF